jgi:hypothetical protein
MIVGALLAAPMPAGISVYVIERSSMGVASSAPTR